jgi:transketolase
VAARSSDIGDLTRGTNVPNPSAGYELGESVALRAAFGDAFVLAAQSDERLVAVTADLGGSVGLPDFGQLHPDRYINCGVAEQDMIGISAGLAISGWNPFAVTFGSFIGRAMDHVRQSIGHNNLKVNVVGSHGGISNAQDGASAHAIEDVAMFRAQPHFTIVIPADPNQLFKAVRQVAEIDGPTYLRLYREPLPVRVSPDDEFEIGKARHLRTGSDVTVAVSGPLLGFCLDIADELKGSIGVDLIEFHTIRPFDDAALIESASKTGCVLTVEDHVIWGGLGSAVAEVLSENLPTKMARVGHRDYAETGKYLELAEACHIGPTAIRAAIKQLAESK